MPLTDTSLELTGEGSVDIMNRVTQHLSEKLSSLLSKLIVAEVQLNHPVVSLWRETDQLSFRLQTKGHI